MNRIRDKQFNIRLTEKEFDMFERKRKISGFSKTDFFMKPVRGSNIKVYRFDDEVKAIMQELRKIGVDLNQAAYLVNIMQDGEALRELHLMYEDLCKVMKKLSEFMDKSLANAKIAED